jgi:hypothetical protein
MSKSSFTTSLMSGSGCDSLTSEQVIKELSELVSRTGFQDQVWKTKIADGRYVFPPNLTASHQNGDVGADPQQFLCKLDATNAGHGEVTHHGVKGFRVGAKRF